jgi:carbon-monoxide dehydrogenase large subunit
MEVLAPYTLFGQKGIGEGGAIAPPAAITNAVNDALKGLGAELSVSPVTPRRVLQAISAAKSKQAETAGVPA